MRPASRKWRGFALYEVLIGLTIFVVGTLAIGRSIENCMHASSLSAQEERVRQVLANRMAEIQATPGAPDLRKELKVETGYGLVVLKQETTPAGLKDEKDVEMNGISLVRLSAQWERNGVAQTRRIEFYVYRIG